MSKNSQSGAMLSSYFCTLSVFTFTSVISKHFLRGTRTVLWYSPLACVMKSEYDCPVPRCSLLENINSAMLVAIQVTLS